jgi:hypothetical protein
MSRILTQEELNEVKTFAESLGFESRVLTNWAKFSKRFNELTYIYVFYDNLEEHSYIGINSESVSIVLEEFEQFIEVMNHAQMIAKELEK